MERLQQHETLLTGSWVLRGSRVVGDESQLRIKWLVNEVLEQLAMSPTSGAWETLFRDPADGRLWEQTYPHSELHGGGPLQLSLIDPANAELKYGWKNAPSGSEPRSAGTIAPST